MAFPWYTCQVMMAGPADDGKIYIRLTDLNDGAFDNRWFYALESMKREMLATALAAATTGRAVSAELEALDEYSRIKRLYIKAGVGV